MLLLSIILTTCRTDGLTIDKLTLGHPQRRGCICCFEGDDECTLIDDPDHYPCIGCEDTGAECEWIVPPELKSSCERCKRKCISCSYRLDGGRNVMACDACDRADENCCAGPYQGSRSRFDNASQKRTTRQALPVEERVFVACTQCRQASLRCSLKRTSSGPCNHCFKVGAQCNFVFATFAPAPASSSTKSTKHLSTKPKGKCGQGNVFSVPGPLRYVNRWNEPPNPQERTYRGQIIVKNPTGSRSKRQKSSLKSNSDASAKLVGRTSGITHIFITTSFCHPIKLNHQSDPMHLYPCSWCASPVFGLWGHGVKENVEVIPFGSVLGNEEINNGHAQDGIENDRMCVTCTEHRVSIVKCVKHQMKKIEGLERRLIDPKIIGESIEKMSNGDDEESENLVKAVKWCTICIAPAEYTCCSTTSHSGLGKNEGCGLLLCVTCADILGRIHKGMSSFVKINVMDQLIKVWKNEEWKRGDGEIRADVEFIESNGGLVRRWEDITATGEQ